MSLGILSGPIKSSGQRRLSGLGALGLGATMPADLAAYFPYEAQNWSQYDASTQQAIISSYSAQKAQLNSQLAMLKKEGGCDATVSGRLAGQLKEVLIKAGADPSKLSSDPAVFGAGECAEWWRLFGHSPTQAEATSAVPATWFGNIKITLSTVCGKNVTLPSCAAPVVAPPPAPAPVVVAPPPVTLAPVKPKMSTASMLVGAGILTGVAVVGYAVAKKKGWIK